jgi:heme exporter protein D
VNWNSWREFLAMGGYGFYIWGSYIVTLVLLIIELAGLTSRGKVLAQQAMRRLGFDKSRVSDEA